MVDIRVGKTSVPNPLVGLDRASAEVALLEADLVVAYAISQYSTQYTRDKIMAVDVTEGADIDPGSTVTLTASLGIGWNPAAIDRVSTERRTAQRRVLS